MPQFFVVILQLTHINLTIIEKCIYGWPLVDFHFSGATHDSCFLLTPQAGCEHGEERLESEGPRGKAGERRLAREGWRWKDGDGRLATEG